MSSDRHDVVVAGSGPAALAATAALARQGLRVVRVGPPARWAATYCCWWDEVVQAGRELGLGDPYALATRYERPLVRTRAGGEVLLPRAYARLDNAALAQALRSCALDAGAAERPGRLAGVGTGDGVTRARLADGVELPATLVIDATGSRGVAVTQQRAWGEVVGAARGLLPEGGALFMDWVTPAAGPAADGPPAFLYGMELGDGTALLELTSLAARPPVALDQLRGRLHALLDAHGVVRLGRSERVAIALGRPATARRPATLGFGAAAGLVHPATGYSVAHSLLLAPGLAQAVAAGLPGRGHRRRTGPPQRMVWSPGRRTTAYLLDRGLATLLPLGTADLDAFFAAFFTLPADRWQAYLDLRSSPRAVAGAMTATLRRLPPRLRLAAVRGVVTRPGASGAPRPASPQDRTVLGGPPLP